MKSNNSLLKFLALMAVVSAAAQAARADDEWNHFGLDYRAGFNMRTKFSHDGEVPAPAPPGAGSAVDRIYTDGFVKVDVTGNFGGQSWNWGYNNTAQVVGNTLSLHATEVDGVNTQKSDPNNGFAFDYERDFGHETWGRWGMKIGFGFSAFNEMDNSALAGTASLVTDNYAIAAPVPPAAPYAGTYNGPGALINTPAFARGITPLAGGALITGTRKLDGNLYDLHLGPFVDVPLGGGFSVNGSAGLSLGVMDSTFSYNETTTTVNGSVNNFGSEHNTSGLLGTYIEGGLAYRFCKQASAFAGLEYQYLGEYTQNAGGRSAQVDLSQSIYFKLGLQFHF